MDACIRVLSSEKEIRGIACISFLKDELLDPSGINDDNVDAYMFLIDSSGKPYYIFDILLRFKKVFSITHNITTESLIRGKFNILAKLLPSCTA